MFRPRTVPIVLLAVLAALVAGCGSTVQDGTVLTVYMGPGLGEGIYAGAAEALADAGGEAAGARVELVKPDAPAERWSQSSIAAVARTATQDSRSTAYIGDADSDSTRISAPITNEAGLLQIAPVALDDGLLAEPGGNDVPADVQSTGERTLGSIDPAGADAHEAGYEAMAVILDSIERAEDPLDRADVIAAFLATTDRQSELGIYSIGPDGAAVFAGS